MPEFLTIKIYKDDLKKIIENNLQHLYTETNFNNRYASVRTYKELSEDEKSEIAEEIIGNINNK